MTRVQKLYFLIARQPGRKISGVGFNLPGNILLRFSGV
jgi:hypothetical protein